MGRRLRLERTELPDFYFKRFRAEFRPAVNAWLATRPLRNPKAPLTPFAMPQYKLAAAAEAQRLDAAAEVSSAEVRRYIQRGSNYVLGVVLSRWRCSSRGISTKLTDVRLRTITLTLGCIVFLGTLIWIATSPVSVATELCQTTNRGAAPSALSNSSGSQHSVVLQLGGALSNCAIAASERPPTGTAA